MRNLKVLKGKFIKLFGEKKSRQTCGGLSDPDSHGCVGFKNWYLPMSR